MSVNDLSKDISNPSSASNEALHSLCANAVYPDILSNMGDHLADRPDRPSSSYVKSSSWRRSSAISSELSDIDTSHSRVAQNRALSQLFTPQPASSRIATPDDSDIPPDDVEILDWRWGIENERVAQFKVKRKGEQEDEARWEFEQYLPEGTLVADFSQRSNLPADRTVNGFSTNCAKQIILAKVTQNDQKPADDDPHADWREYEIIDDVQDNVVDEPGRPLEADPNEFLPGLDTDSDSELPSNLESEHVTQPNSLSTEVALHPFHVEAVRYLCRTTNTEHAFPFVITGLPAVLPYLNPSFTHTFHQTKEDTWENQVVRVTIWIFVCHRMRMGCRPKGMSISTTCAALSDTAAWMFGKESQARFISHVRSVEQYLLDGIFLNSAWYLSIPVDSEEDFMSDLNSEAKEYYTMLTEEGLVSFVDMVIEKERNGPKTSLRKLLNRPEMAEWARSEMVIMFAAVDRNLLLSCIKRRLSQDSRRKGHPTRAALKANARIASEFPCQYINILCDRSGSPPTTLQCYLILQDIALYLSTGPESNELATKIDQAIGATTKWPIQLAKRGLRRYPDWRKVTVREEFVKDHGRRSIIENFMHELALEIEEAAGAGRIASARSFAWVEIGFSNNAPRRLKEHANHLSSNYLMNLMHAAFQIRYPGFFVLQQEILLPCFAAGQSWLGEIAFSQIGNCYTKGAAGFSHYPAGLFNGSSYRQRSNRQWDPLFLDALRQTPLTENLAEEKRLLSALQKAYDQARHERLQEVSELTQVRPHLPSIELLQVMTKVAIEIADLESQKAAMMDDVDPLNANSTEDRLRGAQQEAYDRALHTRVQEAELDQEHPDLPPVAMLQVMTRRAIEIADLERQIAALVDEMKGAC